MLKRTSIEELFLSVQIHLIMINYGIEVSWTAKQIPEQTPRTNSQNKATEQPSKKATEQIPRTNSQKTPPKQLPEQNHPKTYEHNPKQNPKES